MKRSILPLILILLTSILPFMSRVPAQPETWNVEWFLVRDGISIKEYNISIQNLEDTPRWFNLSVVIDHTNFNINQLRGLWLYEPFNRTRQVNVTDHAWVEYPWGWEWEVVGWHWETRYWVEWEDAKQGYITGKVAGQAKCNLGVIRVPGLDSYEPEECVYNGTKWFKLKYECPIVTSEGRSGSSGRVAVINEQILEEYHPWWNSSWSYRMNLTFDNSGSAENLVNFVVMVHLNDTRIGNWSHFNSDGSDVRFVDDDEATELSFEIEQWNHTHDAWLWVKVPQIDAGSTTDHIWMYYGNPSAGDGQDVAGTWDNYRMIHHLEETSGSVLDSTSNDFDGTATPTALGQDKWIAGRIDGGLYFDGSNDYVHIDYAWNATDPMTIEFWYYRAYDMPSHENIFFKEEGDAWPFDLWVQVRSNSYLRFGYYNSTNDVIYKESSSTIPVGSWTHIAVVWNTSHGIELYLNGTNDGGSITGDDTSAPRNTTNTLYLGRVGTAWCNGTMDELRVSNSLRYPGDFTPPTTAFTPDANTMLLCHFDESSGEITDDASSGSHDGTLYGYPPELTTALDGALRFDGTEDYVVCADRVMTAGNVTMIGYARYEGDLEIPLEWHQVAGQSTNYMSDNAYMVAVEGWDDRWCWRVRQAGVYYQFLPGANTVDDQWHVFGLVAEAGEKLKAYFDGSLLGESASALPSSLSWNDYDFYIGMELGHLDYYNGTIDEIRVINGSRSADWIEAQYLSMTEGLITYGSEEEPAPPGPEEPELETTFATWLAASMLPDLFPSMVLFITVMIVLCLGYAAIHAHRMEYERSSLALTVAVALIGLTAFLFFFLNMMLYW